MRVLRRLVEVTIGVPDRLELPGDADLWQAMHVALDVITAQEFDTLDDHPTWEFLAVKVLPVTYRVEPFTEGMNVPGPLTLTARTAVTKVVREAQRNGHEPPPPEVVAQMMAAEMLQAAPCPDCGEPVFDDGGETQHVSTFALPCKPGEG